MFNPNRVLGRPPHLKKNEWKIGVEEKFLTFAGVLVFLSVDLDEKRCRAGGFDWRK